MAVAAAVEGDACVTAGVTLTTHDVAAESFRPAALDCTHHLQLIEVHVAAVGVTPSGTVFAEDIRDLQGRAHGRRSCSRLASRPLRLVLLGSTYLGRALRFQLIERTHKIRNELRRNARIARRRG